MPASRDPNAIASALRGVRAGPDSGNPGDVWTSDWGMLYRGGVRGHQLGWGIATTVSDQLWKDVGNDQWIVERTLGQFNGDIIDDVRWCVNLHRWGDSRPASQARPRPPEFLYARVTFSAGAAGPAEVLVDWPAQGSSFTVPGSAIRVDVFGRAAPSLYPDPRDLPQAFAAHITPDRGRSGEIWEAPTLTVTITLTASQSLLLPIPPFATAFLLLSNDPSNSFNVLVRDYTLPAPRLVDYGSWNSTSTRYGTPFRIPWWGQAVNLINNNAAGNQLCTLIWFLSI
jgi:hypothetical protein